MRDYYGNPQSSYDWVQITLNFKYQYIKVATAIFQHVAGRHDVTQHSCCRLLSVNHVVISYSHIVCCYPTIVIMYRLNALAQNKTEWKTNLNYRGNVMKDLSSNKSLINTWRKLYYFNSLKLGLNLIHDKRTSHLSPSLSSQCSAILKMSAIFDKPENILYIYSVKARHTNTRIRQS